MRAGASPRTPAGAEGRRAVRDYLHDGVNRGFVQILLRGLLDQT